MTETTKLVAPLTGSVPPSGLWIFRPPYVSGFRICLMTSHHPRVRLSRYRKRRFSTEAWRHSW